MTLDIRRLRYFVTIADSGSLSRAARALNVAQPALSQHVLALEAALGVTLLHRGSRGVRLTEEGQRLLAEARDLLERFAALPDRVRDAARAPSGLVRFGMPGTISEQISTPVVEQARSRFPAVKVRIVEAMSGFVLEWLRSDLIDVGVLYDVPPEKNIVVHHALTEEICLFAGRGHVVQPPGPEIALSEALALPLVMPSPNHGLRHLIDAAARSIAMVADPAVEVDSYSQIKELVARGNGFGLLPHVAIRRELASGLFRAWDIAGRSLQRRAFFAHRADRPLPTATQAVAQLAWDLMSNMVRSGAWQARVGRTPDPFRRGS